MRFFYTPRWLQYLQPQYTWRIKNAPQTLYLTFDDGPIPEVTPFVLDTLKSFGAKATFFCVGDNVRKHPDIFEAVVAQGHSIGNHTYHHLNGWRTEHDAYIQNVALCAEAMPLPTPLFRPPYGKLKKTQRQALQESHKIIMWEVLTYDFDARLSPVVCLEKTIKHTKEGSIIVFHDSLKAFQNLRYVLPRYLEWGLSQNYVFEAITF